MTGNVEVWLLANWFSLLQTVGIIGGLILVMIQIHHSTRQIRANTRQQELNSLIKVTDRNHQLLALGFDHPKLFDILEDEKSHNPKWERRYLQMWLNQLSLIHACQKTGQFDSEFTDSLNRDFGYILSLRNMQHYWKRFSEFYPPSFQKLINGIIEKSEPPVTAAHHDHHNTEGH